VDVEDDLVAEASAELVTTSKKDTANAGLRTVVEAGRERRSRALAGFQELADEGGIDFHRIGELDE
jgi:Arc/MetJ family transcription regulator